MSVKRLGEVLSVTEDQILFAVEELEKALEGSGISLMRKDEEVALATSPENSAFIEKLAKDELSRDVGRAGLETLSIVLYYGSISRREIDYIRGVNSAFIVRHLLVRGLVEKIEDKRDQRVFLYKPTFELLSYLGVAKPELLPDYEKVRGEFMTFLAARKKADTEETASRKEATLPEQSLQPEQDELEDEQPEQKF